MAKKNSRKTTPIEEGLNLGLKSSSDLRGAGIRTVEQLRKMGWEKALQKLVAKFPERNNMNMAAALIGVIHDCHWQKIPPLDKARAREMLKSMKPKKKKTASSPIDATFKDFVVQDQLAGEDIECRRMFGGYGLYHDGRFFGIIHQDRLYLKTDDATRVSYMEVGMAFFKPSATQSLKSYFEVPGDVLEDRRSLAQWARAAWELT